MTTTGAPAALAGDADEVPGSRSLLDAARLRGRLALLVSELDQALAACDDARAVAALAEAQDLAPGVFADGPHRILPQRAAGSSHDRPIGHGARGQ